MPIIMPPKNPAYTCPGVCLPRYRRAEPRVPASRTVMQNTGSKAVYPPYMSMNITPVAPPIAVMWRLTCQKKLSISAYMAHPIAASMKRLNRKAVGSAPIIHAARP